MEGFLADGTGICADVRLAGETCQGSVTGSSWTTTDSICDRRRDSAADPFLECVSGTCRQVCNFQGNTGTLAACVTGTCGAEQTIPEAPVPVQLCE